MNGLEINGTDSFGSVSQNVFGQHFRRNLPDMQPLIHRTLDEALVMEVDSGKLVGDGEW